MRISTSKASKAKPDAVDPHINYVDDNHGTAEQLFDLYSRAQYFVQNTPVLLLVGRGVQKQGARGDEGE